jgi:hypothetical protein
MERTITYDHQMTPGRALQLARNRHAIPISTRPGGLDLGVGRRGSDPQQDHGTCDGWDGPHQGNSGQLSAPAPQPQVTHALQ